MGNKSSPPPPPDYSGAAEATAASSAAAVRAQTFANRPNISTPWGFSTYTTEQGTDPATGEAVTMWNNNITLTPQQQAALEDQQAIQAGRSDFALGLLDNAQDAYATDPNYDSLTPMFSFGATDPNELAYGVAPGMFDQRAFDAYYSRGINKIVDAEDRDRNRAANQGLTPGSKGRQVVEDQIDRRLNDFVLGSVDAGIKQGNTMWNQQLQSNSMNNNAKLQAQQMRTQFGEFQRAKRVQELQEMFARRNLPLNELNALLGGQQVNTPQFSGPNATAGQAQPVNYTGAAQNQYQAGMDAFSIGQAQDQSTNSALGTAAGVAMMMF